MASKKVYTCTCCGKEYTTQKGYFYVNNSFFFKANKYNTVCKKCLQERFDYLIKKEKRTIYEAFRIVCANANIYYNSEIVDNLVTSKKMEINISNYNKITNLTQYSGKSYADTIQEDFDNDLSLINTKAALEKLDTADAIATEIQKKRAEQMLGDVDGLYEELSEYHNLEIFWGVGYTKAEYVKLESDFQDYIGQYEVKTKTAEELFKSIVQTKYEADKALHIGHLQEYKTMTELWQTTMASANIKPSQEKSNELSDKQTFGLLINKLENERPVAKPDPKWADVDGMKKYILVWFVGCLCSMIGIKNKYSSIYEEEISKYTVKPPQYDENYEETETDKLIDDALDL